MSRCVADIASLFRSFRSPSGDRVHFSCLSKRNGTKEKSNATTVAQGRSPRIDDETIDVPCVARRSHGTQKRETHKSRRCLGPLGSGETETKRPERGAHRTCARFRRHFAESDRQEPSMVHYPFAIHVSSSRSGSHARPRLRLTNPRSGRGRGVSFLLVTSL